MGHFRWEKREETALIGMYKEYRGDQKARRPSKFAAKRRGFNCIVAFAELKKRFKHCRVVGPNFDSQVVRNKIERLKKQGKIQQ